MSPELFNPQTSLRTIEDPQVDIWALGVLVFEMFFGRRPFEAFSIDQLRKMYNKGEYYINFDEKTSISKEFLKFITMCLYKNPKERANVEKLQNSNFINADKLSLNMLNREELLKELGEKSKTDSKGNIILNINEKYFNEKN